MGCNFRCTYCFEHSQNEVTVINSSTTDALIEFVKSFTQARQLHVGWFGGEPTLAFKEIVEITEKLMALDIKFESASMITNGYLLDLEKINLLDRLRIDTIQITVDGTESTHNARRPHCNGGQSYVTILKNIERLMNSDYKGTCCIRVNIDKCNTHEYINFRNELLALYKNKKLSVSAGQISVNEGHSYNSNCLYCSKEWSNLIIDQYYKYGVQPVGGFYPNADSFSICTANSVNGFVIAPSGQIYKCVEDIGNPQFVVGSVFDTKPLSNINLVAAYTVGTDPHLEQECVQCKTLPICGGGCANKRLRTKYYNESGLEFHSAFREELISYLEAYYDAVLTTQIAHLTLGKSKNSRQIVGYKIV